MAAGVPSNGAGGGGDDDFVYEGVKLQTAEDYKQHRKVQAIIDAQEQVLDRREMAYEFLWEGRIDQDTYLKAIRMAVERYLMLSKQAIRDSKYEQWFWRGEPPTLRGRSPYGTNDEGERELEAIPADKILEIPEEEGTARAVDIVEVEMDPTRTEKWTVDEPVLRLDEEGRPEFGLEPNILGILPMREVGKQLVFQGLESFWDAEDPIRRQSDTVEEHPTRMRESKTEIYEYQIPEQVSLNAFDQINEFWWLMGMSIKMDRGQTIIKDFDMSHHPKYVHTDGSPPV